MRFEFLVRAGIDSVSINPDAAVFTCKLVASIEQRIMLEKALGQVKTDPDWDLPTLTKSRVFKILDLPASSSFFNSSFFPLIK